MVAPVMLAAIAFIAGHPTSVVCDADVNPSPFPAPPGFVATAWTYRGGNVIHAHPAFCAGSSARLGSDAFARAIDVFIHEAARARGFGNDSCVQMMADIGVFDVLRRFYKVPFFSSMSRFIGAQVLALTRTLPARYQPELCWATGTIS